MTLYDHPLYRDWLTWLTLVSFLAIPSTLTGEHGTVLILDWIFALIVQFFLFGVIPGSIRIVVRRRRE